MRTQNILFLATALFGGCDTALDDAIDPSELTKGDEGKADSSVEAIFMDFDFDGDLLTSSWGDNRSVIQDQLLFTIGHLNGTRGVGRLDKLTLSNVTTTMESGLRRIRYHAKMPVAWGSRTNLPRSYSFTLPRDVSYEGQEAFTAKYKASCVDWGAHDVNSGSMWYYYRPSKAGCVLDASDVVKTTATCTVSSTNTTGKYPEYHKVWEDKTLKVVAVFGKFEDGATSTSDAGIAAYNEFVGRIRTRLANYPTVTVPATIPTAPGVGNPDVQFTATLPGGRSIQVNVLLVDKVSTASEVFFSRYSQLATRADLIAYNGHAGLGQNVRALAKRGTWVTGQYLILFMNGCDTFAYVDGSLADTRAAFNPGDPSGTKYMDIVTNGMPAFFASDASATMALVEGLLAVDNPVTYEGMFRNIDASQVVLVTGEQDNIYYPGYMPGGGGNNPPPWAGIDQSATVARNVEMRWQTPALPAGSYQFQITGSGDADLYVRTGSAPTTSTYDCRPYKAGSNESCLATVNSGATVHVMVRGYAQSSSFRLVAKKQ